MKVPKINSEQEYFDLNEKDWNLSDKNQKPKNGDQVITQNYALPMDGKISIDDENMGFKALYYRCVFIESDEFGYCIMESLDGDVWPHTKIDSIRVVPEDRVWDIE